VDYLAFDHVFPDGGSEGVSHQIRFPWRVAAALARRAGDYDIVDASTGDAWLWGSLTPSARRGAALIARAHGLEHTVDEAVRSEGQQVSWKYPLYHGGFRLWEVRRSLRTSDHCVMLNSIDEGYARDRLGVPADRVSVLPNGIRSHFLAADDVVASDDGPLRLCFLGSWIPRKGVHVLGEALAELERLGVDYELSLLGTQAGEAEVLAGLPEPARSRARVVPSFANEELPALLSRSEVLVFPSLSEGSSVALLEAMACGLVPVATRVGAAEDLIEDGRSGILVNAGDASALAAGVAALNGAKTRLLAIRKVAQETARGYSWENVAGHTEKLYERVMRAREAAGHR
jgi:glycosyltransferase involved in cell wall biosynthesis